MKHLTTMILWIVAFISVATPAAQDRRTAMAEYENRIKSSMATSAEDIRALLADGVDICDTVWFFREHGRWLLTCPSCLDGLELEDWELGHHKRLTTLAEGRKEIPAAEVCSDQGW